MAKESEKQSRYQRVKQILNEAQGDACPDYQGYGRFWELPLERFLEVTIYGVRMIAPAREEASVELNHVSAHDSCCGSSSGKSEKSSANPSEKSTDKTGDAASAGSCCHSSTGSSSGSQHMPGRGAASGLIKGLKGEFPFDGTQFPRLLWGGASVSDSDVLFIQKWIDDGCPADDKKMTEIEIRENADLARARGDEEHPLHPGPDNLLREAIMKELANVNPLWHRLRWPGGNKSLIFEAYPTPDDIERILQINNFFAFGSGPVDDHFFGALENVHNLIHNFTGGANPNYDAKKFPAPQNREEPQYGDMVYPGMTAFDPIFWAHHSNVDRLWFEWQKNHPNVGPDNPASILPPWSLNVDQVKSIHTLGYEYVKSSHLYPANNKMPITKFKSAKAGVHPQVLADHKRAELRIHNVQYATRGGAAIRAFLNLPKADANTPTRNNDHFVGQVHTFAGFCVGGPGHCDVPPEKTRKYDLRKRPHKTPSNFRLDATETVRKLKAKGEKDLHINLVVLDIDGKEIDDALWMDGVSLNFLD